MTMETMREKRKGRMIERLLVAGLLGTMVKKASAQNAPYNTRVVDCNTEGRGYMTIEAMNADIQDERLRVLGGQEPPPEGYLFPLCPNLAYDASTPIRPDLDNIIIGCPTGEEDNPLGSQGSCVLFGGQTQVEVSSFSDTPYPVEKVTVTGVTFGNVESAAVSGPDANSQTTVVLDDVVFSAGDSPGSFLTSQSNNVGLVPYTLEVKRSTIEDADVSDGFMNEGGDLKISELTVRDSTLGALVSASDGVVQIDGMEVRDSDIGRVVSLQDGADGRIDNMSVRSVTGITEMIMADGQGTAVVITNSNVAAIPKPENVINSWTGLFADNGGSVTISDSTFSDTQGFRHLVYTEGGSTINVVRVDFLKAISDLQDGTRPAAVMHTGGTGSTLNLRDSLVQEADDVRSIVLASFGGNLVATNNCFDRTYADIVVLVDKESDYTVSGNAIENMESGECQDSGVGGAAGSGRLGKETSTGECLTGGTCTVTCEPFADFETCEQIVETTDPPSSSPTTSTSVPTVRQSDAPSSVPTTSAAPTPETFPPTTLTALPTLAPTSRPTSGPTDAPTIIPTIEGETLGPSANTTAPTLSPDATGVPTSQPTPVLIPEDTPVPTAAPSGVPSQLPTIPQTESPTTETHSPTTLTRIPTTQPTSIPTTVPTSAPTSGPTIAPTPETWAPTSTRSPTSTPTISFPPSSAPTAVPTTQTPSVSPSGAPTTLEPTSVPTTLAPTSGPTVHPTISPTIPPTAAPTRCIPRPIYVSARNPMYSSSSKNGKGKRSRYLKMDSKGKRYSTKGKGYSAKGKGYSTKGKGYSKGQGITYGHSHPHAHPHDHPDPPEEEKPDLPYCTDVFKPIIISKGKGKGKGKGTRALAAPTKSHTPRNLQR